MRGMSDKKQVNIVLGVLGIILGVASTSMGGYLLTMTNTEKAVSQSTMIAHDSQCKRMASSMEFRYLDSYDTTTFYREIKDADEAYPHLISMQSLIMNCQAKTLIEACVGWDCDSIDEVREYQGMPMVFTMTNNYKVE